MLFYTKIKKRFEACIGFFKKNHNQDLLESHYTTTMLDSVPITQSFESDQVSSDDNYRAHMTCSFFPIHSLRQVLPDFASKEPNDDNIPTTPSLSQIHSLRQILIDDVNVLTAPSFFPRDESEVTNIQGLSEESNISMTPSFFPRDESEVTNIQGLSEESNISMTPSFLPRDESEVTNIQGLSEESNISMTPSFFPRDENEVTNIQMYSTFVNDDQLSITTSGSKSEVTDLDPE